MRTRLTVGPVSVSHLVNPGQQSGQRDHRKERAEPVCTVDLDEHF